MIDTPGVLGKLLCFARNDVALVVIVPGFNTIGNKRNRWPTRKRALVATGRCYSSMFKDHPSHEESYRAVAVRNRGMRKGHQNPLIFYWGDERRPL